MASDGLIRIDIEVDGKQVTVASNALDSLEAAALRSGKGAKSVADGMSDLSSSSSRASKDLSSTSGAVDSLANASTSASKNVAGAASNLGDLGSISSSTSRNLQDTRLVIGDIAGGSTAASGSIRGASDSLNNMGGSANNAADAARRAAQETESVNQQSNRASISIKDLATSLGLVALASKALSVLKSSLDSAISRFDTLAGFPIVMERMGFSSEQASDSINKLSNGIQGLPTTLDGIVASTQRIAILTGDLDTATDTALSLNNAFLASGSSAGNAERGLTQYVQMLSKGSVDIMSWRTLQETMGYALKETAKEFGFAGKAAQNDLYAALKGGDITFEDFNAKLIQLNDGVGGFADMAATGSAGIATSFSNLKNAVTVGVTGIIASFDRLSQATTGKNIYENLDSLKVVVKSTFKVIGSVIEGAAPIVIAFASGIQTTIPVVKTLTPAILGLIAAYAAFVVVTKAKAAIDAASLAINAAATASKSLTLLTTAQITAQGIWTKATIADTAARIASSSTISLQTLLIGALTGKISLSVVAQAAAAVATYAWGAAVKFLMGPIGWITAGIGLLVAGVIALVKWFNKSTEEGERLSGVTKDLNDSTDSLNESLKGSSKAYEKNQNDIAATAQANSDLITKIEELSAVENKTTEQKKELQSYVDTLNGSVKGLSLAYSEEANTLNMSSEQMAAKIKLMQEQDSLTASQERFLAISKEQAEVDSKLKETNALREEWNQKLEDGSVKSKEYKTAIEELDEQETQLTATVADLGSQQVETEKQITASIEAVAEATKNSVDDQVASYEFLEDSQKDIVDSLTSTWQDYQQQATNMFDTLSEKSEVSLSEMTKNLEENQRVMANWSENIATLAKRGIDEGLLDTLRAAGPESAGLVKNLVDASDDELKKLSESFANGAEVAKSTLSKSLGSENAIVMDSVGHLVTQAGDSLTTQIQKADFASIGKAMPEGAAKGVTDGTVDVIKASEDMAKKAEEATRGYLDINSPSGKYEDIGGFMTAGVVVGVDKGTPAVVQTMQNLAKTMTDQFKNIHADFVNIGNDTTAGLNQGLTAGQGKVMATARGLANNVAVTMRKELDIHSPSGVTRKIGGQTGQGFLKGLKGAEKEIEKAAKKTAKAATSGTKKSAQSAVSEAKKAAQAAAANFKEAFDSTNFKFKMGEIDSSAYIKSLEKVKSAYAKTPEQIRKVDLEINKIRTNSAKEAEKSQKDAIKAEQSALKASYENSKNYIDQKKRDNDMSLEAELAAWLRVQVRYKEGTKERIDADKNVSRVRMEIQKAEFENSKNWIDKKKYYNDLSLTEELAAWRRVQSRYLKGTKEREEADKNIYRVKKEINDQLISMSESYSKKISEISKKLVADELKVNEDLAKGITAIKDNLNKDILKAEEDRASKSKAINDKLLADQQREMDDYLKAVEDSYNKFNNISGGLFDYFKIDPAKDSQGLIRMLESQVNGLDEWEKQMTDLSGKAIDEGLLEELRQLGPKALPELMAFNNMTEDQLEKYSALYQEKSAKARALAEKENAGLKNDTEKRLQEMRAVANAELSQLQYDTQIHVSAMRQAADAEISQMQNDAAQRINEMRVTANAELDVLKTEWVEKIGEINKTTKEELDSLKVIGKNAAQGLLDGLASMEGALVSRATSIAEAVKAAMASALDIHSPSRWMRDFIAGNMALGFIAGVDKNESKIVNAASHFAELMKPNVSNIAIPNVDIRPFNPSFSGGNNRSGRNTSTTTSDSSIYHVTIDAKNVKEFNDVVKLVQGIPQANRSN